MLLSFTTLQTLSVKPQDDLQAALANLKPGQTLLFQDGEYALAQPIRLRTSGAPGQWITLAAAPGARPIFNAAAIRPANLGEASSSGAIDLDGQTDIRLVGLEVRNSYGFGVRVNKCERIDLCGLKTHRSFAPGIGVWNSKQVRVLGCEVTQANIQEMRLFGSRDRECPHEAISIAGVDGFEVAYNQVHDTEKEGIDVKEVSRRGIVHHNWVHNLKRQAYYADAWFGELFEVEFVSNVAHDAEWGFVVSVEHSGSSLRDVAIRHNIAYKCRASGIYFGTWGGDGPRKAIRIENNSLYANGQPTHWAGPTGNIDLRSKNFTDVLVRANRTAKGGAFEFASAYPVSIFADRGLTVTGNWFSEWVDRTGAPAQYGEPLVARGEGTREGDPGFMDPGAGDFRLKPGAKEPTMGALPNGATVLPAQKGKFPEWPRFDPNLEGWPEVLRS